MGNFIAGLKAFYAKPYNEDGTALQWALFLGFTIVVTFLWSRVVKELVAAV